MRRRLLPEWFGARARLAEIVIALAVLFAVAQAMGAAHLLLPVPVLVAELAAGAALVLLGHDRAASPAHRPSRSTPSRGELAGAGLCIGVVAVQWSTHVAFALGKGMTHPDTLWYHQPFAATFVQQHAFTGIEALGYDAARFFPFNSQLLHSLGMLAYGNDIASPFVNLAWTALALLAGWCIGARRGAGHVAVVGMAVILGLPILTATQPGQASSDIACAALFLAAIALLLESGLHAVPTGLAGLAAGMALSTKITIAAPIALLAAGVVVVAVVQRRRVAALTWTIAFVVTGSFWFVRDWVIAGTPLPWFDIDVGPVHWASQIPPQQQTLAHDVFHVDAWRELYLDGIWQGLGRAWPVIVGLLFLSIAVLVLGRRSAVERLVGTVVAAGIVGYMVTPLTGGFGFVFNLRYLSPILLLAVAVLASRVPTDARWRCTALVAAGVLVAVNATMPNREQVPAWPRGELLPVAALLALLVLVVFAVWRTRTALALGGALLALVGAFWFAQRHYLDHRYIDDGLGTDDLDAFFATVHDANVVAFGTDGTYPMFGKDLSNTVGRGDLPPSGLALDDCAGWRRRLRDADYVVVLVGQFGFFPTPDIRIIADDPGARVVLRAKSGDVYRMDAPFDPAC